MKKRQRDAERALSEAENIASATECTGLMPALPEDEAQADAEAALYDIHAAQKKRRKD